MSSKLYRRPNSRLPDANKWIRLLHIRPGQDGDEIICDFKVTRLTDPLRYAALSYTWGEQHTPRRTITIDGRQVEVGDNCYYAIWQLRRQTDYKHFWIDAVCINQLDIAEKSSQVGIMGSIYEFASMVFISLGAHEGNSELAFRALQDAPISRDAQAWEAFMSRVSHKGGTYFVSEIWASLLDVAKKPYWLRLWVFQEAVLARDILLLCGRDVLYWQQIERFEKHAAGLLEWQMEKAGHESYRPCQQNARAAPISNPKPRPRITEVMAVLGMKCIELDRKRFDLPTLLEQCWERKCSNVLDRIYGLLHILEKPVHLKAGLVVDYRLSPWEVLKQSAAYIGDRRPRGDNNELVCLSMQRLLEALEIDWSAKGVQDLIRERRTEEDDTTIVTTLPHKSRSDSTRSLADARSGYLEDPLISFSEDDTHIGIRIYGRDIWKLHRGGIDRLFCESSIGTRITRHGWDALFETVRASFGSSTRPHYLVDDEGQSLGLVWPGARPGDFLVRLKLLYYGVMLDPCLVLRPADGTKKRFNLIGQAILLREYQVSADHELSGGQPWCRIEFAIDDIISWAAQNLAFYEDAKEQVQFAAQRTTIRPALDAVTSYAIGSVHFPAGCQGDGCCDALRAWLKDSRPRTLRMMSM